MKSYAVVEVEDIAAPVRNALVGGPFGSNLTSRDYMDFGVPVIRGANLGLGRWVGGDFVHVSEKKADSLSANCASPGDLIFTQRGTLGQTAIVPDHEANRYLVSQSQMKLTVDPAKADVLYLYYVFSSEQMQDYIRQNAIQTGVPHTNLGILRKTPIPLPALEEQRAIAATLGALDDKIESNRRTQATGEQLIRALVEASLRRSAGIEGTLGDYCTLVRDAARATEFAGDENYIGLEHMPRGSIFLDSWGASEALGSNKSHFHAGDVLFGKLRPYFKKVGVAPINGICSTDILVLRPHESADTALVATVAASDSLIDSLSAAATGTRMPRGSWTDIKSWRVPTLTADERHSLAYVTTPLFERLTALTHETRRLERTRESLLPELLSARIRVPVEDVAT